MLWPASLPRTADGGPLQTVAVPMWPPPSVRSLQPCGPEMGRYSATVVKAFNQVMAKLCQSYLVVRGDKLASQRASIITPMELIAFLIDFILHVDKHLAEFVQAYGMWVYALLFLIVFVETGLVVMPFLPGDSLLFIVGALAGAGLLSWPLAVAVLLVAAILGDQTNYTIGRYFGPKVFQWENSRFFNRHAFDQAHAFYERYGGITIVIARFMPFIRTFAPFVAGVAEMTRSKFTAYNVGGAVLWVVGLCGAGYLFGNLPWVQANLSKIIWALIIIPGLIAMAGAWRARRRSGIAEV